MTVGNLDLLYKGLPCRALSPPRPPRAIRQQNSSSRFVTMHSIPLLAAKTKPCLDQT